ncbi:MAG: DNA topoisomerase III [Verrucomicrobiales bacterium]|nr:DNA topoisomerase III [Verrucomicrobiales bacterium]|tara:strand:- start:64533 stop:67124 length:2592 start_codon:yes stop_codon:yes gene_type:complete
MGKTLVIAEKPSVQTDLARVLGKELGKFQKKGKDRNSYFENDTTLISSAVGHLVELKMPEGPNGRKLPWGIKYLPVIPNRFELQPIEKSESRLNLLLKLIKRREVEIIVNACDAGREGELIFRYIMALAGVDKPLRRMWMQSMTDASIVRAFKQLREDASMQPLADAALCRSESDWLVGLNGSRALTAFNSRHGGFNMTTAGRVQTPTLVILAERERAIRNFKERDYWEVHAEFEVATGTYAGRWFREDFQKPDDDHARAERLWTEAEAEAIVARCTGQMGVVEENKKPSKQIPPQLFDLTTLQREAGSRFGFSARNTLGIAQALYERHKLLTYPRTDSKCLPEDYIGTVREHLQAFARANPSATLAREAINGAAKVLAQDWLKPNKRIFNNAKISDHFAIIPTGKLPGAGLKEQEQKIFDLVLRRLVAIFFPPAEFENTRRITRVGEDSFLTTGKILMVPGYLEVYGRQPGVAAAKDELVPAETGEAATVANLETRAEQTKPPARYTEATLLSAMETAGKRVDDEELREAMSERGLGTPATRAAIIEGLISHKYVFRNEQKKSELVVSNKGLALIDLLEDIGIEALTSPELTGEWEYKLKQMEGGELTREAFMGEIKLLTESIVHATKDKMTELANRTYPDLEAVCPSCDSTVLRQTDGNYECRGDDCKFKLNKYIASHKLVPEEAKALLEQGRIGPFEDFKNRFGQPFVAELKMTEGGRGGWKPEFIFEGDEERESEANNLTNDQLLCNTELPDGSPVKVYQTDRAYLCPDMAPDKQKGGTRIAKEILKKEIPAEEAIRLFTEGKTGVIHGFISKRGRPFSAFLILDKATGKLAWEFPPRPAKKKAAKKKSAKAKKTGDGD